LQPANQTNDAGTDAGFWIVADGTAPLTYQWFKDAVLLADLENVTDANGPALILSSVLKADEGAYQVVVSNLFGSVTSLVATLTVMDPAILVPPWSTNRSPGESVSLSVTAGGTPPLNYQWSHNGRLMTGATEPSLTIRNLSAADAGYYTVAVTNAYGRMTSPAGLLTVNQVNADASFSPVTFEGWGSESYAALAVQPDGKILIGQNHYAENSDPVFKLLRINSNGNLDRSFNVILRNGEPTSIIAADGRKSRVREAAAYALARIGGQQALLRFLQRRHREFIKAHNQFFRGGRILNFVKKYPQVFVRNFLQTQRRGNRSMSASNPSPEASMPQPVPCERAMTPSIWG
jgi:hypothetical protein